MRLPLCAYSTRLPKTKPIQRSLGGGRGAGRAGWVGGEGWRNSDATDLNFTQFFLVVGYYLDIFFVVFFFLVVFFLSCNFQPDGRALTLTENHLARFSH